MSPVGKPQGLEDDDDTEAADGQPKPDLHWEDSQLQAQMLRALNQMRKHRHLCDVILQVRIVSPHLLLPLAIVARAKCWATPMLPWRTKSVREGDTDAHVSHKLVTGNVKAQQSDHDDLWSLSPSTNVFSSAS